MLAASYNREGVVRWPLLMMLIKKLLMLMMVLLLLMMLMMMIRFSMMLLVLVADADADADNGQVLTNVLNAGNENLEIGVCPFLHSSDHNFDLRHLLSKGALARLTNSDGLTAEVNLVSMMMTSLIIRITINRLIIMIIVIKMCLMITTITR